MFDVHVQSGHVSNNCSEYWHVEGGSGDLGALYAREFRYEIAEYMIRLLDWDRVGKNV